MQQHRVDTRKPAAFDGRGVADRGENAAQIRLRLLRILAAGFLPRGRGHAAVTSPAGRFDRLDERVCAAALHGDGRHHRDAELGRQPRHIDLHAATPRHVHAIQRQDHRDPQAFHLQRQSQADRQVHGVDDADDEARGRRVGHAPEQHVARDGLIESGGSQAVGAGQIEHAQRASVRGDTFALAAFHGDTRVVSHLLAAAGQAIE